MSFIFVFLLFVHTNTISSEFSDSIIKCDKCIKLKQTIKDSREKKQTKSLLEAEDDLECHLKIQRSHREYETSLRGSAQMSSSVLVVNSDHMAKKFMIKLKNYSKQSFKSCASLKVLLGGHFISNKNETRYYLTTEAYGEQGNTIISEFHHVLRGYFTETTKKIHFILDNHSTNKNYIVLAYFDFLVFFFY